MSWSFNLAVAPVTNIANQITFTSSSAPPGGQPFQIKVIGTGLTYSGGTLTGGNITSMQLIDPNTGGAGTIIQTVTMPTPISASQFGSLLSGASSISSTLQTWNFNGIDQDAIFTPTVITLFGTNGETMVIAGSGFADGGYSGTVTSITHYAAGGAVLHQLLLSNLSVYTVAAGIGSDDAPYAFLVQGNNQLSVVTAGYEFINLDAGLGNDTITGSASSANDWVQYETDVTSGVVVNLTTGTATGGGGSDSLSNIENVGGSAFADQITGNSGGNFMFGWLGNDAISGLGGMDILGGQEGDDTISGGDDNDVINGDAGNDSLSGDAGDDFLRGGAGNDALVGGSNGFGGDTADLSDATSAISILLNAAGGGVVTATGLGTDTLSGIENLIGGSAGDTLIGNNVNNRVVGGGGADVLWGSYGADGAADALEGGDGSDTYFVYETTDFVTETNANQTTGGLDLVYTFSNRTLSANFEYLTLFGDNSSLNSVGGNDLDNALNAMQYVGLSGINFNDNIGNDIVFASYYADTISTGVGNDTLWGSWGADGRLDAMTGGDGADTYYVQEALDTVTETNTSTAASEVDTVYSGINYTLGSNLEYLFIYGSATVATGNGLNNALIGSYSGLQLTFNGMGGNDTIIGGAGNDTIDGGTGTDFMTGSGGADTFSFTAGQANGDYIIDFDGAGAGLLDSLRFVGFGGGATFTQVGATNQWVITYNGGASTETITFQNNASVHASDFLFV